MKYRNTLVVCFFYGLGVIVFFSGCKSEEVNPDSTEACKLLSIGCSNCASKTEFVYNRLGKVVLRKTTTFTSIRKVTKDTVFYKGAVPVRIDQSYGNFVDKRWDFEYSDNKIRKIIYYTFRGADLSKQTERFFEYNSANQITKDWEINIHSKDTITTSYSYDSYGNLTKKESISAYHGPTFNYVISLTTYSDYDTKINPFKSFPFVEYVGSSQHNYKEYFFVQVYSKTKQVDIKSTDNVTLAPNRFTINYNEKDYPITLGLVELKYDCK